MDLISSYHGSSLIKSYAGLPAMLTQSLPYSEIVNGKVEKPKYMEKGIFPSTPLKMRLIEICNDYCDMLSRVVAAQGSVATEDP